MIEQDKEFFINYPIFLKYKTRFDILKGRLRSLVKFAISERIAEIPFALSCLSSIPSGGKVLDLGCAESIFPLEASYLGFHVTGVDFRPYPYKHPNLTFLQADIMNLPFDNQSFDAVSAISTLEHIGLGSYDDPKVTQKPDATALKQVARVLKKQGIFILTVPFGKMCPNTHQRVYDQKMIEALLQDFHIEDIRYLVLVSKEKNDKGMYWGQVSLKEASEVESGSVTKAVCLIKARLK